ncbi:bifunctional methylenetetrahydrofolate dehydrogenase/methenyltetrahydrofolate cyclohydrolase FolD [Agrobacterium vitis]|uniref:Bifunctional protein FolD n=1 Tax=Agrobacterium vitis TaxID=373 RepID=A0A6L6VMT1_AGRVI|nr:bifunctional methylenetetrahydrofolate dehydrogenase/methenyltetrahydrofolate cyclohydrolase FolD [Agrobacterium vitis]MUZ74742.1 bifunctional methylenetetrahydrofolate dehydrogenase/methenyltetrahydrofolate cyclohydrolase FolD [Agrobacterium vitis]
MTATVINGKKVAGSVLDLVKSATASLEQSSSVIPGLAVVIVGEDPASHAYVGAKSRMAKQCGFRSLQYSLPEESTQQELAALVEKLNVDETIHGILVQLPLPKHLNAEAVIQSIKADKDVDGLHVVNAGKLATGDLRGGLISCTPAGAMALIRLSHGDDLSGLSAVVIGRSNLFGKPMSALLLAANATVTTAHSRTKELAEVCRQADILVAAVGSPGMVRADWVKQGATIIDVGINRVPGSDGTPRLVGDVSFDECASVAGFITPVPGGVGPMTIAMLMANTVTAAYRHAGRTPPNF